MRISDWSSDVCSSDLWRGLQGAILVSIIWRLRQRRASTRNIKGLGRRDYATVFGRCSRTERDMVPPRYEESDRFHFLSRIDRHLRTQHFWHLRTAELRVGQARVSTGGYRWATYHEKKKTIH